MHREGMADVLLQAPGRLWHGSLTEGWGGISRYVEVGDDQLAVRQVDIFENSEGSSI